MDLDLWTRTSGTLINAIAILIGTALGLLLQNHLPKKMQRILTSALGLLTIWLGATMADRLTQAQGGKIDGVILGLISLATFTSYSHSRCFLPSCPSPCSFDLRIERSDRLK